MTTRPLAHAPALALLALGLAACSPQAEGAYDTDAEPGSTSPGPPVSEQNPNDVPAELAPKVNETGAAATSPATGTVVPGAADEAPDAASDHGSHAGHTPAPKGT